MDAFIARKWAQNVNWQLRKQEKYNDCQKVESVMSQVIRCTAVA